MFLTDQDGRRFDFDLRFLQRLLRLLDEELERLAEQAASIEGPDPLSLCESAEYLIGLGFVACQGYQTTTYAFLGIEKRRALKVGPAHRSGYTIAELVNHAANFWKHNEEWPLSPGTTAETRTMAALAALGCDESEHPMTHALHDLVLPKKDRLQALLSHLEAWRDALDTPSRPERLG